MTNCYIFGFPLKNTKKFEFLTIGLIVTKYSLGLNLWVDNPGRKDSCSFNTCIGGWKTSAAICDEKTSFKKQNTC